MVLGDNNAAFVTDGTTVTALSVPGLQVLWNYASTGGTLSFVAATQGGGVAINDSQQGVILLDPTGGAGTPASSLQTAVPLLEGTAISLLDLPTGNFGPWVGIVSSELEAVNGQVLDLARSVFGFAQSDFAYARAAAREGVPQNFVVLATTQRDSSGNMFYFYRWSSSTGKLKDLSTCTFELFLDYPMFGTHFDPQSGLSFYTWPLPMQDESVNPEAADVSMNTRVVRDKSGYAPRHGFALPPYDGAAFPTSERIQWSCPYIDDNKFRRFIPDQTIWRSVSLDTDHKWKYRVTRNVDSNTIILPNQ